MKPAFFPENSKKLEFWLFVFLLVNFTVHPLANVANELQQWRTFLKFGSSGFLGESVQLEKVSEFIFVSQVFYFNGVKIKRKLIAV